MTPVIVRLIVIALGAMLLGGCPRPGEEKCKRVCLHYSKLSLDETWAAKMADAPEAERAELERAKAAEWQDIQTNPERGLYACVAACDRPARDGTADCILAATTFKEAKACDPE